MYAIRSYYDIWQAQKQHATIEVIQLGSTGLDIDDPEDLALYLKMQSYNKTNLQE